MCKTIPTVEKELFYFRESNVNSNSPALCFFNFYQKYRMKLRKKIMEEGISHLRHINTTFYALIPMTLIAPLK